VGIQLGTHEEERWFLPLLCKDAYPLPRIDICLDAMASAKWFSTFDLRSAYHHVLVDPADSDKTAFICPKGMFKFRRMPFGLYNAGATFQRLVDVVMSGLHFEVCLVYLDDIIIYLAITFGGTQSKTSQMRTFSEIDLFRSLGLRRRNRHGSHKNRDR